MLNFDRVGAAWFALAQYQAENFEDFSLADLFSLILII